VLQLPPPPSWVERAACRDAPPEWFDLELSSAKRWVERALAVCGRCPVRRPCLEEAFRPVVLGIISDRDADAYTRRKGWRANVTDPSRYGIWGGTSPGQRLAVKHLPVPLRIEVLLAQVDAEASGRSVALARCITEILERWRRLGRPLEVPARTFRPVAARFGGSTITEARRRLGIVAENDRRARSGQVGGWRWRFPAAAAV
jgi:hypothetical protein